MGSSRQVLDTGRVEPDDGVGFGIGQRKQAIFTGCDRCFILSA